MIYQQEILHSVKSSKDLLVVKRVTYLIKPKEKFVRKQEKKTKTKVEILGEFPIQIPFETEIKKTTTSHLASGPVFQNDDLYVEHEATNIIKHYRQPDLDNFIKSKLKLFNPDK